MQHLTSTVVSLLLTVGLVAQEPPARPHPLTVGDPAPDLTIEEWIQGEPIEAFLPDRIYVIEFWATWCGPCIGGMPHLSELQEKYADDGVRIVGVQVWDEANNVRPFLQKAIDMHGGKTGAEVMRYTIATERKEGEDGSMAKAWMEAAGQNGIPTAFLISGGRVAWIGHPMQLDEPLAKAVAGEWDVDAAARQHAARIARTAEITRYFERFDAGEYEVAYRLGAKLVDEFLKDDAGMLNTIAWRIVDPDATPAQQDLDLALRAAERASELTDHGNAAILDTLATVHHARGEFELAVWIARLATRCASGPAEADEYGERLRRFERSLADGNDRITEARRGCNVSHSAAVQFSLRNRGRVPTLEDLVTPDATGRAYLTKSEDPWGNDYVIRPLEARGKFEVLSAGPDGKLDTADDVRYPDR